MGKKNTDLENFINLYERFGIDLQYTETDDEKGFYVELAAFNHNKLKGYPCFYSRAFFDKKGKFIEQIFAE